jgi:hypothetical protein
VKENNIVLLEGKLDPDERLALIKKTMENIDKRFKGIEILSLNDEEEKSLGRKIGTKLKDTFLVKERKKGLTIIGPSNLIKEIKQDMNKIHIAATPYVANRR